MHRGLTRAQRFYEALAAQNQFAVKYDLEPMRAACRLAQVGCPPHTIAGRVVLVGGTNGKGTTAALINAAALAAGLRVGLYTSPHLIDFRERIRLDGAPIDPDVLCDVGEPLFARFSGRDRPPDGGRSLTYFELTTLVAFDTFRRAELDLAVIEVGLGGRLDATNVLEPDVSVITSVSLDHQALLGDTTAAIAAEKAAIARRGRPCVFHRDAGGGLEIEDALAALEPRLIPVTGGRDPRGYAEVIAREALRQLGVAGLEAATDAGFARARWPGRQQVLRVGDRTFLVDGAHNEASIAASARWLASVCGSSTVPVVLGASRGRDPAPWGRALAPCTHTFVATTTHAAPCAPPEEVARALQAAGRPVRVAGDVHMALRLVADEPVVAVIGSLYLVGEVLSALGLAAEDLAVFDRPMSPATRASHG